MTLYRHEIEWLTAWIQKPRHKPLILRGARQVGKSSLVRELGRQTGRTTLELNFERYPEHASLFASRDIHSIMRYLRTHFGKNFEPEHSLLFLDEIQAAPQLIEQLRYFYEELPALPVIAAGSLLEFVLEEPSFSVPVGRIEYMHLHPFSFEDFLLAKGESVLLDWIRHLDIHDPIPETLHQKALQLTQLFWLVGGMPEAVYQHTQTEDFQEIEQIKQNILQTYQEDFYKYGRIKQNPLLRRIFQTLPSLIGEKIKYVHLDPESKSVQVKQALELLVLARIIHRVYHSHASGIPLRSQVDPKIFKTFFLDIGLLCSALGLNTLSVGQLPSWAWQNRGSLAEQFIIQNLLHLRPYYQTPELFYWCREQPQSSAEIDCLWQSGAQIIPIEIKAGKTGQLKSLHYFIQEKQWPLAVRFNTEKPSLLEETLKLPKQEPRPYRLLSLPFYLIGQLNRWIEPLKIL